MVTSLTVSSISCKFLSISVIGSTEVFVTFDFFLDPPFFSSLGRLMRVDVF